MEELESVRIPADIEREDRVLAGLTARQVAILGTTGILLWLLFTAAQDLIPLPVFAAVAFPIGALVTAITLGRRDGLPLYRLLLAGISQARSPGRQVLAPEGIPPAPSWAGEPAAEPLAPLRLPATAVSEDGVIDLGEEGTALICTATTVSFALRTPGEQASLVNVFARWLNSLAGPVQILVRAAETDITPLLEHIKARAAELPSLALERAALDHAAFLTGLAAQRDLLRRTVLIVFREPPGGGPRLVRRADEAARTLAAAGIMIRPLPGREAGHALAEVMDPWAPTPGPGTAAPGDVIKGERR